MNIMSEHKVCSL